MRHHFFQPLVLAMFTLALAAVIPSALYAQERHDDRDQHHDQMSGGQRDDHHDDRHAAPGRQMHEHSRPDPVAQYHHDHPHASARCHDGFFTTTGNRDRACTRHGGIDVWLVL